MLIKKEVYNSKLSRKIIGKKGAKKKIGIKMENNN